MASKIPPRRKRKQVSGTSERVKKEEERTEIESKSDKLLQQDIPEFFTHSHSPNCIALNVEDATIFVSRDILKLASPVFRSMLESDFLEKTQSKIDLPGKTCFQIITLMRCIYPSILDPVTESNLYILLQLGDEYQIESILRKCEDHLLVSNLQSSDHQLKGGIRYEHKPDLSRILKVATDAETYNLERVRYKMVIEMTKMRMRELDKLPEFQSLSARTRLEIAKKKFQRYKRNIRVREEASTHRIAEDLDIFPSDSQGIDNEIYFREQKPYLSLQLLVKSDTLYSSAEALALSSPVFHKMVESAVADSNMRIQLPESDASDVIHLLACVHPNTVTLISEKDAAHLLQFAKEFDVQVLAEECERVLITKYLNQKVWKPEEVVSCIHSSTTYDLPNLMSTIQQEAENYSVAVLEAVLNDKSIPQDVKYNILVKRMKSSGEEYGIYGDYMEETKEPVVSKSDPEYFRNSHSLDDVVLDVHGIKLYANREVLRIAAPNLLESLSKRKQKTDNNGTNEKAADLLTEKIIPENLTFVEVTHMLTCLHPNFLEEINESYAPSLLQIAGKHDITSLSSLCEAALVKDCQNKLHNLDGVTLIKYITLAERYSLPKLLQECNIAAQSLKNPEEPPVYRTRLMKGYELRQVASRDMDYWD